MQKSSESAKNYLSEIRQAKKELEREASEFLKEKLINFHEKTGFFPESLSVNINTLTSASGRSVSGVSCKLEIESI